LASYVELTKGKKGKPATAIIAAVSNRLDDFLDVRHCLSPPPSATCIHYTL
jgi:hypothetical protein